MDKIKILKDEDNQRLIPSIWRSTFSEIVNSISRYDFDVSSKLSCVTPISDELKSQICNAIKNYGATLTLLPDTTWETSVCIWTGNSWDVLIDLWTNEEGQSDLVLNAQVTESKTGYMFHINMVYVP